MRTLMFLISGFLLVSTCQLLVRLFITAWPTISALLSSLFAVLWFAIALANMVAGITRASYSFGEELPIFLLIFLLPAIALFWPGAK